MKKRTLFLLSFIILVPVFYFLVGSVSDQDCDSAARAVIAKLEEENRSFKEADGEIGRCDGLCVDWTPIGCYIKDDEQTWFVTSWGSVWQTE